MLGSVQMMLTGAARALLAGVVVGGGGRNTKVSACGSTPMATDMGVLRVRLGQGWGIVHQQQSAVTESFLSCPPGLARDAFMVASYRGDAYADSVANAGQRVDGMPLLFLPWLSVLGSARCTM
jgi:hypothetical protein